MSDCPTKGKLSPLHTHTNYSVLDGASSIDEYIQWCKDNGAPGLGVTDHGWCIGALELYTKCKKAGLISLPGCEFYVAPDKDYEFAGKAYDYYHVTVWAVNEAGYRNLIKLGSMAWGQDKLPGWKKVRKDGVLKTLQQLATDPNTDFRYVPAGNGKDESLMIREDRDRVSVKFGTQEKPRITFDELFANSEGLVIGTGCLIGALNKAFLNGEFKGAERNLMRLQEVFKGRMFAEVIPHSCSHNYSRETKSFEQNQPLSFDECVDFSPDGRIQVACNNKTIEMARKYDIPLLMTIDSHFVRPEQKRLQDVLLSGTDDGWTFYESYHMYDTETAWQNWKQLHGSDAEQRKIFAEAVENNDVLVNMAKGMSIKDPYHQPTPVIPIELQSLPKEEQKKATIFQLIDKHGRMDWSKENYVERLMKEITVICDNGIVDFADYFLFLEKTYAWAAAHSIFSAPGRGSGAGSLLCYLLKITHLDPIEWELPFERFLSQARLERGKFPDIDCDFGSRDILIAKLREEYGDKMAQCSTLGTLKVKSAIKDACRAILGWNSNDDRVNALTKSVPLEPQGVASKDFLLGYTENGNVHDGHLMENKPLDDFFKEHPDVQDAVMQLLGIPRSVGRHASAFLISDEPISNSVPTCVISDELCTQYQATASNNMVEKAGLIKFDFLRVNTLDDISGCIRMVQKKYGHKVWEEKITINGEDHNIIRGDLPIDLLPTAEGTLLNVYDLPEDAGVFSDLSAGKTVSVFQMMSSLMTGFTKRIRPTKKRHGSDIVALVRPGPLLASVGELDENGKELTMTEAYIARKHGLLPVRYAHPGMEPILKDTYGVAVYQEQLQQMFVDLAGYNLEEADYLRETLAKKKRQDMEKALPDLKKRLKDRGWDERQIEVFVSLCVSSSAYSFNRAHSAAYATVAYQCSYLKHHHPIEWWTSVLQNAKVEDIRERGYAKFLQNEGLLDLPSVNGPTDTFKPINGKIYSPLYIIDGVGDVACLSIQQARGDVPFTSLQNFVERVDLGKVKQDIVHNLIVCGAFDSISEGKTEIELIDEYHYLKKVLTLVLGKGKTDQALKDAVIKYKAKEEQTGKKLDLPHFTDLKIELIKATALPLYRLDVHEKFSTHLSQTVGTIQDRSGLITIRSKEFDNKAITVFRNAKQIASASEGFSSITGAWAGLIQSHSTFSYTDKKTRKKVTALKMFIANDGDVIECVVWPDLYQILGAPPEGKILTLIGKIKESKEPGKWEMSTTVVKFEGSKEVQQ